MITRLSLIELFLVSPIAYFFNTLPINPILKDRFGTVQYYTFQFDSEQPPIDKKSGFPAKQTVIIFYKKDNEPECLIEYKYECFTKNPYFDIAKFINSPMVDCDGVYNGMPVPHRVVNGDKYSLSSVSIMVDSFI